MKWASSPCDKLPSRGLLMRVSSCKFFHQSFVCFSKSLVDHFTSSSVMLEDPTHSCACPIPLPDAPEELPSEEKIEVEKVDVVKIETILKSSIKKPTESGLDEVDKRRVKWMDFMGKELVEIKEYEASDVGDSDDDVNVPRWWCFCTIQ